MIKLLLNLNLGELKPADNRTKNNLLNIIYYPMMWDLIMLRLCGDCGINPTVSGFIPCLKNETRNCVAISGGLSPSRYTSGNFHSCNCSSPLP